MNSVEFKIALIDSQISRLTGCIKGCKYDLSIRSHLEYFRKEKSRTVCVLKVFEKELHALRAMLKSGKSVYINLGHTESSLMRQIFFLNKEASILNNILKDNIADIHRCLDYNPEKTLAEIAFYKEQIAHYEAMKTEMWEDRDLGADEKYVAVASPEAHKALKDVLSK
ncbi:MAG: hypothetical protein ACRCTW_07740 [Lactococcus garvieae]